MRILYITNGFPYPLTSGYLRHYYLIKELSQQHRVTLLSIVGPTFREAHRVALQPYTERILTFISSSKSNSLRDKVAQRVRSLAGNTLREQGVQQMRDAIERLVEGEAFDLMLFSGKQTFPAIAGWAALPIVADMCDATSSRIQGRMRYANGSRLPFLLLEYAQVRQIERRLIRSAAHLLFASCRDREALIGHQHVRATVVPNGVDLDFWHRSSRHLGRNTIVFTGAMDYAPNADAAIFLIEEILPLVRRSVPDAKVLIVGRDPTPRLLQAGRRPGVTITGFVEDVRPYLEQATVFAAPLRFGAGIQNKLLEALAMEVPVVASLLAADGLRIEDGQRPPVQVADDPQHFAALLSRELIERSNQRSPQAEARHFVQRHFTWSRSGEKLLQVIHQLQVGQLAAVGI